MPSLRRTASWMSRLVLAAVPALAGIANAGESDAPLRLARGEHDFGDVEQHSEYTAEVAYSNTCPRPLTEIRVKADCGCYAAELSHRELPPGASGVLRVRFRTLSFHGKVAKTLRLSYRDKKPYVAALRLKMRVVGGIVVYPGRMHFGDVLDGTKPEGSVRIVWYEGVGKPFRIKKVDVGGEPISTEVEPYTNEKKPEWKGWRVRFRFVRPPKRGVYSKRAVVTTTDPEHPRVLVPLTAHVVGKVWVQTSRIYLGLVPRGRTKSASVGVRGFDRSIRLGNIRARARKGVLRVSIEDVAGPAGPRKRLRVDVPADAPVGPLDDIIELRTEVPGEGLIEIGVRGRIFEPAGR